LKHCGSLRKAHQLQRRCRNIWAMSKNVEIVKISSLHVDLFKIILPPTASSADECDAAVEIYDCGKKKAPEITNALQEILTNISSAAPRGEVRLQSIDFA
jgi:hypothetical protein